MERIQAMDDALISRDEVLKRAKFWLYNPDIYYNQNLRVLVDDRRFRTDCSGFVSMALDIHRLHAPNTVDLGKFYVDAIDQSELKPGDLLGVLGEGTEGDNGHVALFVKWD